MTPWGQILYLYEYFIKLCLMVDCLFLILVDGTSCYILVWKVFFCIANNTACKWKMHLSERMCTVKTLKPTGNSNYCAHTQLYNLTLTNLRQFYILEITEGLDHCIIQLCTPWWWASETRNHAGVCVLKHYCNSKWCVCICWSHCNKEDKIICWSHCNKEDKIITNRISCSLFRAL
jgi:hypothetical protein